MDKKNFSKFMTAFIIFLYLFLLLLLISFFWKRNDNHDFEQKVTNNDLSLEEANNIINQNLSKSDKVVLSKESFIDWCNTIAGIKSVSLVTPNNRFYTSSTSIPSKSPVKKIKINWDLWNIFLCVVPDISDKKPSYNNYRKWYNSNTVLKIWDFAWYYDVWWSVNSNQFYDYDSDNSTKVNTKMYWKYYTEELPYYQIIDMQQNLIFADMDNWWIQSINLRDKFNDWNKLLVWWYMNKLWADAYWASSIREFKILWDGDWSIEILD